MHSQAAEFLKLEIEYARPKNVVLVGGPCNGRHVEVPDRCLYVTVPIVCIGFVGCLVYVRTDKVNSSGMVVFDFSDGGDKLNG